MKGKEDSFWYDGNIALLEYKGRQVVIAAVGEIAICDKDGELVHDGCKERYEGLPFKLKCDKDLKRIDNDEYHWENNNWFEMSFRKNKNAEWDELMGEVEYTYDSAIRMGKNMLKDEEFWKQK